MAKNHEIIERPYREALRCALELPLRDQLRLHQQLTDLLGAELGTEPKADREVQARVEALEAMRAAARHLSIGPDDEIRVRTGIGSRALSSALHRGGSV